MPIWTVAWFGVPDALMAGGVLALGVSLGLGLVRLARPGRATPRLAKETSAPVAPLAAVAASRHPPDRLA